MNVIHSCRCCLRCPPDKDLTTPYTHLGVTEIYADMLQQCFDIHLVLGDDGSRGICSTCVGRLRDASDFKLQVQRSQAALLIKVELEPVIKPKLTDEDNDPMANVFDEEPIEKLEMVDEYETGGVWDEDPLIKSETDVMSDNNSSGVVLAELARARQHDTTCSARLERLRGDEGHTTTSIRSPRKSYTCEHCSKCFGNKSVLRKHIQHTHLLSANKDFSTSTIQTKLLELEHERNEHNVTNFKCVECEYATIYKKNFEAHLKNHTLKNLFICKHCSYTCQYRSYLLRHELIHTGERFFTCSDCDFKCNDKSNLRRHRRIHSSDKPLQCSHCDYKCREKTDLQRHLQSKHTKVKPFKCTFCEYMCTQRAKLRIHERKHTKEKPFGCSSCDYKSSYKSQLQNHERIHTGEPFICSHCKYTSLYKEHLQRHVKAKHPGEQNNVAPAQQVLGN